MKNYGEVSVTFERLKEVLKQTDFKSGMRDISVVYSFVKALDPQSIVSPGEQVTTSKAPGLTDRVANALNQLMSGDFLTENARKDALKIVQIEVNKREDQAMKWANRFRVIAKDSGIEPSHVVDPDFGGIPTIFNDDEFNALRSGRRFYDPKGNLRQKP